MKKQDIRCEMGHKLFEVYDGSRLLIKMKCANEFRCKHKKNCDRITKIQVGSDFDNESTKFQLWVCPTCKKKIFVASTNSSGRINIKCQHCGTCNDISIGDTQKSATAA